MAGRGFCIRHDDALDAGVPDDMSALFPVKNTGSGTTVLPAALAARKAAAHALLL